MFSSSPTGFHSTNWLAASIIFDVFAFFLLFSNFLRLYFDLRSQRRRIERRRDQVWHQQVLAGLEVADSQQQKSFRLPKEIETKLQIPPLHLTLQLLLIACSLLFSVSCLFKTSGYESTAFAAAVALDCLMLASGLMLSLFYLLSVYQTVHPNQHLLSFRSLIPIFAAISFIPAVSLLSVALSSDDIYYIGIWQLYAASLLLVSSLGLALNLHVARSILHKLSQFIRKYQAANHPAVKRKQQQKERDKLLAQRALELRHQTQHQIHTTSLEEQLTDQPMAMRPPTISDHPAASADAALTITPPPSLPAFSPAASSSAADTDLTGMSDDEDAKLQFQLDARACQKALAKRTKIQKFIDSIQSLIFLCVLLSVALFLLGSSSLSTSRSFRRVYSLSLDSRDFIGFIIENFFACLVLCLLSKRAVKIACILTCFARPPEYSERAQKEREQQRDRIKAIARERNATAEAIVASEGAEPQQPLERPAEPQPLWQSLSQSHQLHAAAAHAGQMQLLPGQLPPTAAESASVPAVSAAPLRLGLDSLPTVPSPPPFSLPSTLNSLQSLDLLAASHAGIAAQLAHIQAVHAMYMQQFQAQQQFIQQLSAAQSLQAQQPNPLIPSIASTGASSTADLTPSPALPVQSIIPSLPFNVPLFLPSANIDQPSSGSVAPAYPAIAASSTEAAQLKLGSLALLPVPRASASQTDRLRLSVGEATRDPLSLPEPLDIAPIANVGVTDSPV